MNHQYIYRQKVKEFNLEIDDYFDMYDRSFKVFEGWRYYPKGRSLVDRKASPKDCLYLDYVDFYNNKYVSYDNPYPEIKDQEKLSFYISTRNNMLRKLKDLEEKITGKYVK